MGLKWLKGRFVIWPQGIILWPMIFILYVPDLQIPSIHPQLVPKLQVLHLPNVQWVRDLNRSLTTHGPRVI